jgi:hypothetical protein
MLFLKANGNTPGAGKVGIGTTTPAEKLEVSGNIKLSGASPTYKITNVATPTASSDVATKGYVDAAAGSVLKSLQHMDGSIAIANCFTGNKDVTISAVDTTKAFINVVRYGGTATNGGIAGVAGVGPPKFANGTTVRFSVDASSCNGASTFYYTFDVIEFN